MESIFGLSFSVFYFVFFHRCSSCSSAEESFKKLRSHKPYKGKDARFSGREAGNKQDVQGEQTFG